MVQKTISVNITGEGEIDRISKKISHLRNAVLNVEEKLKAGLSDNPAISLKIKLDASQFKKDFTALKKEIENNPITVNVKNGKGTQGQDNKAVSNANKSIVDNANQIATSVKKSTKQLVDGYDKAVKDSSKELVKGLPKAFSGFEKAFQEDIAKILKKEKLTPTDKSLVNNLIQAQLGIDRQNGKNVPRRTPKQLGMFTNADGQAYGAYLTPTGAVRRDRDSLHQVGYNLALDDRVSQATRDLAANMRDFYQASNIKDTAVRGFTDFLNALDQVKGALDTVNQKLLNFISTSARLAGLNPFKSFLSGATSLTRAIVNLNTQLGRTAGGAIVGTLRNSFNSLRAYGTQAVRSLASETQELGDAMVSYRNNMRAMDMDEDSINRNLKEMGDYGKASVYNAGDLLEMLSTYKAYGLSDDESKNLTKAMAGLVSNRSDSNEALGRASKQLNDIFVRGNASTQDLRIMRSWFNPLASAKIQASLEEIAKGKGYSNLQEAIEDRAISAEDTKKAIIELGLTNKTFKDSNGELVNEFQAMVNNIATPRQAIDNLKETLANLFAYDKVTVNEDGTTNVEPGALGALYNRTAQLIKGMADIAGSDTFEKGVTALGNDLARTIDSVIDFGSKWNVQFSTPFINSLKNFYRGIKEGVDINGIGDYANNLTRNVIEFNNLYGKKIGEAIGSAVKNGSELLSLLSELGKQFVGADGLKILDELGKFFNNLGKVAVDTNAVRALVETYKLFYEGANEVVSSAQNIQGAKGVVESYRNFLYALKDMIVFVGSQTNIVPNALEVVSSFIDMVTGVVTKVRGSVSVREVNQFSNNIKDFFTETMGALEDIYAQIISSAIKAGSSQTGKQFFESVKDFIVSVNEAILSALQALGGGNAQAGIEKIMSYATLILDSLSTIVKTMGEHPLLTGGILVATKFGSVAISVIQVLASVIENMKILSGTSLGGGLLGKLGGGSSSLSSVGAGIADDVADSVALSLKKDSKGVWRRANGQFASQAEIEAFTAPKKLPTGRGLNFNWANATRNIASSGKNFASNAYSGLKSNIASNGFKATAINAGKTIGNSAVKSIGSGLSKYWGSISSGTLKGNLIAMASSMLVGVADDMIQNSNASGFVKGASSTVKAGVDIAGWAGTGAAIGSALFPGAGSIAGAIVGGGVGLGLNVLDWVNADKAKKAEQKAIKDQAKRISDEKTKAEIAIMESNIDQLAENSRYVRDSYVKSIRDTSQASLSGVRSYLEQQAVERGTSLKNVLTSLGSNIDKVPADISKRFVDLNGQLVNFGELQEITGLGAPELLGVLNELYATTGKSVTELKNEAGEVVEAVDTYTKEQESRRSQKVQQFKDEILKSGFGDNGFEKITLNQLETINNSLKDVLSTTFEKKSDKRKAIIDAITSVTGETDERLKQMNDKQLEGYAKTVSEAIEGVTATPEEQVQDIKDRLKEHFGKNEKAYKAKLKELEGKTVEEYQQALSEIEFQDDVSGFEKQYNKDSKKLSNIKDNIAQLKTALDTVISSQFESKKREVDEAIIAMGSNPESSLAYEQGKQSFQSVLSELGIKSKELQNKVIDKVTKGSMTLESAIKSLIDDGELNAEEIIAGLTSAKQRLKDAVQKAIDDGKLTQEQGAELIEKIDILEIDTSVVGKSAQELKDGTKKSIDDSAGKLGEGANKTDAGIAGLDTSHISAAASALGTAIANQLQQASAKLAEAQYAAEQSLGLGTLARAGLTQSSVTAKSAGLNLGTLNKATSVVPRFAGGIIPNYLNNGGLSYIDWKKRSTDTVPAMLTPGEFVLRKKAVDSIGVGLLRKMNNQGIRALQNVSGRTIINNIYNNNNAQVTQNVDNKSSYLNSMNGLDRLMRYV